uniref:Secreted protein n=1 Tax=Vespula pensylvanica TaxID=30213 RepID=A0A834UEV5_VESPE|nr:hypothetical protein H0235_003319 [Vespula pensylvanica]
MRRRVWTGLWCARFSCAADTNANATDTNDNGEWPYNNEKEMKSKSNSKSKKKKKKKEEKNKRNIGWEITRDSTTIFLFFYQASLSKENTRAQHMSTDGESNVA